MTAIPSFEHFLRKPRFWLIPYAVVIWWMGVSVGSFGAEYEVSGRIAQSIIYPNAPRVATTNEFTVFVKDCAWLIQTVGNSRKGGIWRREVGSTNGGEIFESNVSLDAKDQARSVSQAFITGRGIPVELVDEGVDGHLWLMFASQCYWSDVQSNWLTPIYDWHASIGANPNFKVKAKWELLGESNSLPRNVVYLGEWGQTNALYTITGTKSVAGTVIPSGFIFEEYVIGPLAPNGFVHEMISRKRVEAQVTSVKEGCSKQKLVPMRGAGKTVMVDWRLKEPDSTKIPSYRLTNADEWPSVEEAKQIVEANSLRLEQIRERNRAKPFAHRQAVRVLIAILLAAPPIGYLIVRRPKKA